MTQLKSRKLNSKEKRNIEQRFKSGDMGYEEYRKFKLDTGYGVCRFCGRCVKFATIQRYKAMVRHKCNHGEWCRTGKTPHPGGNYPQKYKDCHACCDEWHAWTNKRKTTLNT
jgi:hypothetical protein